jgi:DNA-binding transcriptional ArsR family regulator
MPGYHSVLDALGDPTRRAIVEALRGGPVAVGRIADGLPVSRPAVSRHLRVLAEAGLVRVQSAGSRHLYALDPDGLEAIRAYFDEIWVGALANLKAEAEAHPGTDDGRGPR